MNTNNTEPDVETEGPYVVVGGGHAAASLCAGLVEAGLGPRTHLVCDETTLPYQRPPLSKSFLKDTAASTPALRSAAWFADAGVQVHLGDAAVTLDRSARQLHLASGRVLPYARLVLATGTRARALPGLPAGLANVALLRSLGDAERLRTLLHAAEQVTVLGGGFIGLEIAATARALGKTVQVLELAPRLLARSVSPELSAHVLDTHRGSGMDVQLQARLDGFEVEGNRLQALHLNGVRQAVDLLISGIGAVPETSLAAAAGLRVDDGVVVDAHLRSSDPHILAVGDCARAPSAWLHCDDPNAGRGLRLESVQNANDQARTAVATLLGREEPYRALPWFWSEQGALRLQMAGLLPAQRSSRLRAGATPASFSWLHYVGDELRCVESVNAPLDHMAARKLLETGRHPTPAQACDPATPLKSWI
jgi:3-phenylpropionate/trans-cinnamate dioxygenase ferredoxin reductase component